MKNHNIKFKRLENIFKNRTPIEVNINSKQTTPLIISIIALLFSFLTIIIMGATFYQQYVIKKMEVNVGLSNMLINTESFKKIDAKIHFSNTGNRVITVNNTYLSFADTFDVKTLKSLRQYGLIRTKDHDSFILPPNENYIYSLSYNVKFSYDTKSNHDYKMFLIVEYYNQGMLNYHVEQVGLIAFEKSPEEFSIENKYSDFKIHISKMIYTPSSFQLKTHYTDELFKDFTFKLL